MTIRMIKIFFTVIIVVVFLQNGTPIFSQKLNESERSFFLSSSIDQVIEMEPALKGSLVGISIRDPVSGEIIYEHNGNTRLAPASNMKLLTAAVALSILGENHTFSTEIYTDGTLNNGLLSGNLYVKGKGDPTILKEDLDRFAEELAKKGIQTINGNIIGDNSWYDNVPFSEDLAWSDENSYYGASISALTLSPDKDYDAGTVKVSLAPNSKIGHTPIISITPKTTELKIVNTAKTVDEKGEKDITITRLHHSNTIEIEGTIPYEATAVNEWVAVESPMKYTLDVFLRSLSENGITLNGSLQEGFTPDISVLITKKYSIPLSELLIPFMKLSNNTIAETLLKELGKVKKGEGSFEKGLEVMEEELLDFGLQRNEMMIRDASGISPIDLITANQITQLLHGVQAYSWFPTYLHALPVAGDSDRMTGGTLQKRLSTENTKGMVFAKTGTLTAVSSLSGYVETRTGKKYIFSILLNHLLDEDKGKIIEDKIVELIASE